SQWSAPNSKYTDDRFGWLIDYKVSYSIRLIQVRCRHTILDMNSGNVEASLLPKHDDIESQNEKLQGTEEGIGIDIRKAIVNLKKLKSFEILKSALKIFTRPSYSEQAINFWYLTVCVLQSVMFLALLYKYLDWSAFWNMGMVISCTEEQTGVAALGLSDYYGRHSKKTGFQLMLGFFIFGNVLRLPCLYAGLCNGSFAGVMITSIVIMSVSIGNLVKWIAFLLYFQYCKQQTMEKKVDDHKQGKTVKAAGDLS
uniref:Uncharacterized protein n=1 Tax=Chenopodium quinoa TaxID=63459 RepID=A0A803L0G8_CHEQI